MQLWKKRLVLLLTIALLGSEVSSGAMIVQAQGTANETEQTADVEKVQEKERLPIPEDYITFGEDVSGSQEEIAPECSEGEKIPVIQPDSQVSEKAKQQAENTEAEQDEMIMPETNTDELSVEAMPDTQYEKTIDPDTISANTVEVDEEYTVSANGIEGEENCYLAFTPDTDGYYTLWTEDITPVFTAVVYDGLGNALTGGTFDGWTPLTAKLEAGTRYVLSIGKINYVFSSFSIRITKARELTMNDSKVASGMVSDVAVVKLAVTELGIVSASFYASESEDDRICLRTDVSYTCFNSFLSGSVHTMDDIWANAGEAIFTIVNPSGIEHAYEVGLFLTPVKEYDTAKAVEQIPLHTYYWNRYEIDDEVYYNKYYRSIVQYVPDETGAYFIAAPEDVSEMRCIKQAQETNSSVLYGEQIGAVRDAKGFSADLVQGETYYICSGYSSALLQGNELKAVSVKRQDAKILQVGEQMQAQISAGLTVKCAVEKGKSYRVVTQGMSTGDTFKHSTVKGENFLKRYCYWGTYEKQISSVIYANEEEIVVDIVRGQIDGASDAMASISIEEYPVQDMEPGQAVSNEKSLWEMEPFVVAIHPAETGVYSFYGLEYLEDGGEVHYNLFEIATEETNDPYGYAIKPGELLLKSPMGNSFTSPSYDEFYYQYELEAGKTYYATCFTNMGNPSVGDFLLGVEKARNYSHEFSEQSKKVTWDIALDFGAVLNFNVPESGFYKITVSGDAQSYRFGNGLDRYDTFTVYNNQDKSFFAPQSDNYTLQMSREFKVDDATDHVKVTLEKLDLEQIPLYDAKSEKRLDVTLRESEDYVWSCFTAEKAGTYELREFYPNGSYNPDTNESIDCNHTFYRMENDNLQSFWADYDQLTLEAGETIYVKTATCNNYGAVSYQMISYDTQEISIDVAKTIHTDTGYVMLHVDIPESGVYRLDFTQDKANIFNIGEWGSVSFNVLQDNFSHFLSKGEHDIYITPAGLSDASFTVKFSKENVYTEATNIPVKQAQKKIWVKYVANESAKKIVGVNNPNKETGVTVNVYQLINEDSIEWMKDTSAYEDKDNYCIINFIEGQTYYFSLYLYKRTSNDTFDNLTMYFAPVTEVSTKLDNQVTVQTNKVAYVNLEKSEYPIGWYQVDLEGLSSLYRVYAVGSGKTFKAKEDGRYYFYNTKQRSSLSLRISGESDWEEDEFKVSVSAYQPVAKEIQFNEKVTGTADEFVCYSFTASKAGEYTLGATGITSYKYQINGQSRKATMSTWYDSCHLELEEGDVVSLFAENNKNKNYSLKIYQTSRKVVFDYDEYAAFIASGGSITVKNRDDLVYGDWDDPISYYIHCNYDQYLVINNRGFKNQNQLWLLDYIDVEVQDATNNTYGFFEDSYKERYPNKWESILFEGFMKPNGQKPASTDVVDPSYLLLAKFRPEFVWVQEIKISGVNALKVGASEKLTAVLDTKNQYEPTNSKVKWSSSDSSIVSVDQTGLITANKAGQATITVQSEDQLRRSASLLVTVPQEETAAQEVVYVSKVVISGDNKLYVGDEAVLTATLDTDGKGKPSREGVTWASSDETVATVDQTGKVTAICAGTAVITAASNDGKASATYTITVENIEETKISLNESKITVKKGTSYKWLTVTFNPENTTIKTLTWKSDNTKVATVNSKGVIKAKGVGKATITVTSRNGKKDSVKVTVTKDAIKMNKITISSKETLYEGDTLKLDATITPVNTTNQKLKWTSSNEAVATVSSKGVVTAKKAGKATITVTAQDGTKKTDKCVITVKKLPKVDGLKLSSKSKKTVELTWKEVKDADGYNIYMADSKNGKYRKIGTTKAGVTSFTREKLTSNKKYYFKVAAYQKTGRKTYEGKFSSVKKVKVK